MITKLVRELAVGDIVLGIGSTTFTEPHTVYEVTPGAVLATGGSLWPMPIVGHHTAHIMEETDNVSDDHIRPYEPREADGFQITLVADECVVSDHGSVWVLNGTDADGVVHRFGLDARPAAALVEALNEEGELVVFIEEWQLL